jgi:hypothetical protein
VHSAIADYLRSRGQWDDEHGMPAGDVTIVHGACPTGADFIAHEWAITACLAPEEHPAQWKKHGRSAGPRRNAEMVALGADICLAFIRSNSPGATSCATFAEQAGIPTIRIEATP